MDAHHKFTVIYSFKVLDGMQEEFIDKWKMLTEMNYEFEGSYGSRLHKVNDHLFIAYAQWPDKERYDQSGKNLPGIAVELRQQMRNACSEIKTEYEMDTMVMDLLTEKQHDRYKSSSVNDEQ